MFLPLRVIRQALDRLEDDEIPDAVALEATVARVLLGQAAKDSLSGTRAITARLSQDDLDALERLGLAETDGDSENDRGDGAALLRLLAQARRAGISESMLPASVLGGDLDALSTLVRAEVDFFRAGAEADPADGVHKLAELATTMSERLVRLARRKLLLPALEESALEASRR